MDQFGMVVCPRAAYFPILEREDITLKLRVQDHPPPIRIEDEILTLRPGKVHSLDILLRRMGSTKDKKIIRNQVIS